MIAASGRSGARALVAIAALLLALAADARPVLADRPVVDDAVAAVAGWTANSAPTLQGPRSLWAAVMTAADVMGVALDPGEVADRIADSRVRPATSQALARLVLQVTACARISAAASIADVAAGATAAPADDLRACAASLHAQAAQEASVLRFPTAEESALRIWPVVSYSPDEQDDVYLEDYALSYDVAGDDWYRNNQGGNMIDLKRSVTGGLPSRHQPARGCETVFPDVMTGRIVRGPGGKRVLSMDGPECSPLAALFVDASGDDRYGALQAPHFPDSQCTPDKVVRRISTQGSGVIGVGILIDAAGDDLYLAKTGAQGAGHLGGVGVLQDDAGDDRYVAIRGAQGLGFVGGLGLLRDRAGDDEYTFFMPRPHDPEMPNDADGAGGVIDDTGLGSEAGLGQHHRDGIGGTCDRLKRSLQGAGLLGGLGVLLDEDGNDRYVAPGYINQPFLNVRGVVVHTAHGSQGSGYLGGAGMLWDLGGRDRYTRPGGKPAPGRADGTMVGPKVTTPDEQAPANGRPLDGAVFYDSGG